MQHNVLNLSENLKRNMKNCKNKEHSDVCEKDEKCFGCGRSTCSPNFAYHVCIRTSNKEKLEQNYQNSIKIINSKSKSDLQKEELKQIVDDIISCAGDPEAAHSMEDDLHLKVINEHCPEWVVAEIKRLSDTSFPRWCA